MFLHSQTGINLLYASCVSGDLQQSLADKTKLLYRVQFNLLLILIQCNFSTDFDNEIALRSRFRQNQILYNLNELQHNEATLRRNIAWTQMMFLMLTEKRWACNGPIYSNQSLFLNRGFGRLQHCWILPSYWWTDR